MRIVGAQELRDVLDPESVIAAVWDALVGAWSGAYANVEPMQILFPDDAGGLFADCHVKAATSKELPYFAVKLATGFYGNPARGLPVNNGMRLLLSAETGQPFILFQDEGWMTAWRTAAAGALAAGLARPAPDQALGIIGAGQQAELQAIYASRHLGLSQILLWSRNPSAATALAARLSAIGLQATEAPSIAALTDLCRLIITATPALQPLLMDDMIRDGTHIVALGADSPGKQELDVRLGARSGRYIVDHSGQCLAHGEFGAAVRAGVVGSADFMNLGESLSGQSNKPAISGLISIVDLTGLGAQDLAIAALAGSRLSRTA